MGSRTSGVGSIGWKIPSSRKAMGNGNTDFYDGYD